MAALGFGELQKIDFTLQLEFRRFLGIGGGWERGDPFVHHGPEVGVCGCGGGVARENAVPFAETTRNGGVRDRRGELVDGADAAGNVAVEEAVREAGEERGGEVVAREKEVGGAFA